MLKKLVEFSVDHPIFVIVFWVALFIGLGSQIPKIQQNNDFLSYLDKDNPVNKIFDRIGDRFKGNSYGFVIVSTENMGKDVFNVDTIKHIDEITKFLDNHKFVSDTFSLTNMDYVVKTEDGIEVSKLITDLPTTQEECNEIRKKVMTDENYVGSLVSKDGKYTSIIFKAINREGIKKDVIARDLLNFLKKKKYPEKFYYGGLPFQMEATARLIKRDIKTLVPLVILLMFVVLYLSFRTLRGVFLPILAVIISTVSVMGLMAIFKKPITIISSMMPVILIAVGSAYGIHFVNRYYSCNFSGKDKRTGIKIAGKEIVLPVFMSSITTLVGFLSLITATIIIIREFGVFTGIGIFIAFLTAATLVPAILTLLKLDTGKYGIKHGEGVGNEEKDRLMRFIEKIYDLIMSRSKQILIVSGIVGVIALFLIPFIKREVNFILYLPKDEPVRISADIIKDKFGGSEPYQIYIKGKVKTPYTLFLQKKIRLYAQTVKYSNNLKSLDKVIKDLNYKLYGSYAIPKTEEGVANLYIFVDGKTFIEQLASPKTDESLVNGVVDKDDTGRMRVVVNALQKYITDKFGDGSLVYLPYSDSYKDKYMDSFINSTLEDVGYIFKFYEIKYDNSLLNKVGNILRKYKFYSNFWSDERDINIIKKEIIDYSTSDESEVAIPESKGEIFANKVVNECKENKACIVKVAKAYAEEGFEEEDFEQFADSLSYVINRGKDKIKVNKVIDDVYKLINIDDVKKRLPEYRFNGFSKEFQGEIWDFINGIYYVTPKEYKAVVGKAPAKNDIHKLDVKVNGVATVIVELDKSLVMSQLESLALAIVIVFFLLAIEFRSFSIGAIGVLPILITILLLFGFMPILGIALDTATAMIASIAIGIGIDYSIHFLTKFRHEYETDRDVDKAINVTLHTSGRGIIINAISVMFGFLLLILSVMVPLKNFGILTGLTMVFSSIGALTIVPSIIKLTKAKFFKIKN